MKFMTASTTGLTIALEVFPLSDDVLAGTGNVAKKLVETLQRIDKKNRYILYFRSGNRHVAVTNANWKTCSPEYGRLARRKGELLERVRKNGRFFVRCQYLAAWLVCKIIDVIYCHVVLPLHLVLHGVDVYIGTTVGFRPLFFFGRGMKRGLFLYDLAWELVPGEVSPVFRYKMRLFGGFNHRRTDFLLAISGNTRKDFEQRHRYTGNIYTVHLAADKEIFYHAPSHEITRVRQTYNITGEYVLAVGRLDPRKNLIILLAAFSMMRNTAARLVLVGKYGWGSDFSQVPDSGNIRNRVIFTGYAPAADLAPLYSGASVFVYPSLYEGFGLPVLEAMQCGCPVIAADNSSIPEVAGGAALLFSAEKADELAALMERLLSDQQLRKDLRQKGLKRAQDFSWDKSAEAILDIIHKECKIVDTKLSKRKSGKVSQGPVL